MPPNVAEASLAEEQRPLLLALGFATFMVSLDARVVAPLLPAIAPRMTSSTASTALPGALATVTKICRLDTVIVPSPPLPPPM